MPAPRRALRAELPFPSCRPVNPPPPRRPRLPLSIVLGAVAGCSVAPRLPLAAAAPTVAAAPAPAPGSEMPAPPPPPPPPAQPRPPAPAPSPSAGTFLPDQAALVLALTNEARVAAGLRTLAADGRLADLAAARSQDMGDRGYFSHTTPEGETLFAMLPARGIGYTSAGENIALNSASPGATARTAFSGWMNSPGHKANILREAFGRLGVGVYRTPAGKTYLTQVFLD